MTDTIVVVFVVLIVYFLPTIIAVMRDHNAVAYIALLNLIGGWTGAGWVFALAWAIGRPVGHRALQPRRARSLRESQTEAHCSTPNEDHAERIASELGLVFAMNHGSRTSSGQLRENPRPCNDLVTSIKQPRVCRRSLSASHTTMSQERPHETR